MSTIPTGPAAARTGVRDAEQLRVRDAARGGEGLGAGVDQAEAICLTHEMVFAGRIFRPVFCHSALQAVKGRRSWNFRH